MQTNNIEKETLGVIGVGTIGGTLVGGLIDNGVMKPDQIKGSTAHEESAKEAEERYGIEVGTDNLAVARSSEVVLLAVKPQGMNGVLKEINSAVRSDQLIITLAAAVKTSYIEERVEAEVPVVRAMPNTPATVNEGMTVICPGEHAGEGELELARDIFASVGRVETLKEEKLMDAVTGLSGGGPAYGYLLIEALSEGGVKVGLPRELATILASQSLLGAAKMVLDTEEHPAKLKDMVTTPAGVTVDGLMKMEEGGVRVALIKAVVEATEKSSQINLETED